MNPFITPKISLPRSPQPSTPHPSNLTTLNLIIQPFTTQNPIPSLHLTPIKRKEEKDISDFEFSLEKPILPPEFQNLNSEQLLDINLANRPPYHVTFDNSEYVQQSNTEYLSPIEDLNTNYTVHEIFLKHFPEEYRRCSHFNISFPDIIDNLSLSNRRRLAYLILNHYEPPPDSPNAEKIAAFCEHYIQYPTIRNFTKQEYDACKWVTEDRLKAASLFVYYGPLRNHSSIRSGNFKKFAASRITKTANGVHLELLNSGVSIRDQILSAMQIMRDYCQRKIDAKQKLTAFDEQFIEAKAYQALYLFNNYSVSIPYQYFQRISGLLTSYFNSLRNVFISPTSLPLPKLTYDEEYIPEDWFTSYQDQTQFDFTYSDFPITFGASQAIINHSKELGYLRCLETLKKSASLGDFTYDKEYKRKELIPYFTDTNLKSAYELNLISKPKYGFYKLDFLKEENNYE